MSRYLVMGLRLLKAASSIWMMLIVFNFIRSLCWVLLSIKNRVDIDLVSIKRAICLLKSGIISAWIVAAFIYFEDFILVGNPTTYAAMFMYVMGILFLIITIVSVISAIIVAWSNNGQSRSCVSIFKNLVRVSFLCAIVLWSTIWTIL